MKHKILFLLHLPPPVHGSSMVGKFIKGSERINNNFQTRYINLLASKNVDDTGKLNISKILGIFTVFFQLLQELSFRKPKLCYLALTATGFAFYRDVLLITLLKLFRVTRIYHLHNKGVKDKQNTIHRFFYRYTFKNAKVIVLSESLYKDIDSFVSKNDLFVCPNGIPSQEKVERQKLRVENETPTLLFLSNLIESKGAFVLLEALALLKKKGTDFNGIFVGGEGDISKEQFNNKLQELELQENVHYQGKRYGAEKEEVFSQATIFAFPTYYDKECFPLVLLEVMQHRLPIVTTNEGGIPDLITEGENGFLVPQRDVKLLAGKLELLINEPELRKSMGQNGFNKFQQNYTLDLFEKRLCKILTASF